MGAKQRVKLAIYEVAKATGLFAISRFLMRQRLLILCYHGFQYSDEAAFRPKLFMQPDRFANRLEKIGNGKYVVLPLAEAVNLCRNGNLPANTVTITIDDGFCSVLDIAAPMLKERDIPATLYVTSYYVTRGNPIFRLVIQYMFWKSANGFFEPVDSPWSPNEPVNLGDSFETEKLIWQIIEFGELHCDEDQRRQICIQVASRLGLSYESICDGRGLSLLAPHEIRRLSSLGIDVQLHTHRHNFPSVDLDRARKEIRDNREVLEGILDRPLEHFCYPSGAWSREVLPLLTEEGITTATTCEPGMNDRNTDPLALFRVLDQDDMEDIEFEAELAGFCELVRVVTGRRRSIRKRHRARA